MDTIFAHSYECERLNETQGSALPHYYFPGASTQGGRDGILVKVRPEHGQTWIGTFAFGDSGVSGIFTTPDPQRLCIVSNGEGYFVNTSIPTEWEAIRAMPIKDVRSILAQEIIVFADYTDLVAYGRTGVKWKTERLVLDELKITEVTDISIKGEGWNPFDETRKNFIVDAATGRHEGAIKEF